MGESRTQFLIISTSGRVRWTAAMMPRTDFEYVLVILEDVSGYTWLRPSRACTANGTVEELVGWCATFGPPITWVSDNATHFRNRTVRRIAKALGVEHRFSVANSAWTTGRSSA